MKVSVSVRIVPTIERIHERVAGDGSGSSTGSWYNQYDVPSKWLRNLTSCERVVFPILLVTAVILFHYLVGAKIDCMRRALEKCQSYISSS